MSAELDALVAAEAALKAAEAKLVAVESTSVAAAEPTTSPSKEGVAAATAEAGSVYLGHVGEPAVEGKDF